MSLNTSDACIIIASHISNPKRIGHLSECLHSLLKQTYPIAIYLSISFENENLQSDFAEMFSKTPEFSSPFLYLFVKTSKTPQMRHMYELMPLIENKHKWLMFCDDDDTYEPMRAEIFLKNIANCLHTVETQMPDKRFIGVYESTFGKDHREQRHEFWCYCVHINVLETFMNKVAQHDDVLNHSCCDVLFGEYLRRIRPDHLYAAINTPLYNYRTSDNSDSITGSIQTRNKLVRKAREITIENMSECAKELNEYLTTDLAIYLHDTFLRTIIGNDFENILQNEFKSEIAILHLIDRRHIVKMMDVHNKIRDICNRLYDIKI
jgi:glycosyltransferase involved in cell wall biosynthesis